MPRSLMMTLRAIQHERKETREKLAHSVFECESPFEMDTVPTTSQMHGWMNGENPPPFPFQHRMGVLSRTRSGVIHAISGFYCHLMDAAKAEDEDERKEELDRVEELARKRIRLCEFVLEQVKEARSDIAPLQKELDGNPYTAGRRIERRHCEFIIKFFKAYRGEDDEQGQ